MYTLDATQSRSKRFETLRSLCTSLALDSSSSHSCASLLTVVLYVGVRWSNLIYMAHYTLAACVSQIDCCHLPLLRCSLLLTNPASFTILLSEFAQVC
jgi:hypothetical protein